MNMTKIVTKEEARAVQLSQIRSAELDQTVVKWRDQPEDKHTVWVLLDGKDVKGVTSDWQVKERWEDSSGSHGSECYFVDDPNDELFEEEDEPE
jgi:hypothetical protein